MCCNAMLFIVCYGRICSGQENFFAYMWQCYIHSKFRLCCFVLSYFIPNCFNSYGSSGREVEYQISYPEDVSSIPTLAIPLFIFHRKNLRNFRKTSGNLRKTYGKFRRKRKTTEIQLYLCGPQTGNIFRSMDSLVLRHPIICTEFNVRSFHSVGGQTSVPWGRFLLGMWKTVSMKGNFIKKIPNFH